MREFLLRLVQRSVPFLTFVSDEGTAESFREEWYWLIASRSGELGEATTRAEATFRAVAPLLQS